MSYENYVKFRDALGLRDNEVARRSGVTQATFPQWKKGLSEPKIEKRRKIAEVLGVTVDQLDGIEPQPEYYIDAETRQIVEEMHSNKDLSGDVQSDPEAQARGRKNGERND